MHDNFISSLIPSVAIALVFFLIAILSLTLLKSGSTIMEQKEEQWDYAVENGFTFYLDGTEIDPGTVSMKQYSVDFDPEAKKVFLTSGSSKKNSTYVVPVMLPSD